MNESETRALILDVLGEIAPEADLSNLRSDLPIQEQVDIDSLDLLSLMTGIFERTHLEIPQVDYQKVSTLNGCVEYLSAREPGVK